MTAHIISVINPVFVVCNKRRRVCNELHAYRVVEFCKKYNTRVKYRLYVSDLYKKKIIAVLEFNDV